MNKNSRFFWMASAFVVAVVSVTAIEASAFETLPRQVPAPAENPVTPAKVELGRKLYFDKRLSADNTVSCNSCHNVMAGGEDGGEMTREEAFPRPSTFYAATKQAVEFATVALLAQGSGSDSPAFGLAIVGAEYVLRWLPKGTHDWRKFVRPSELEAAMRASALTLAEIVGVSYNPLLDRWSLGSDLDVNYLAVATKA